MQQQSFIFKERAPEKADAVEKARPKIYTVSEVIGSARALIEARYPDIWVVGEVSGYKLHSSGHQYFTLKDASSILPAAIFRGSSAKLQFKVEDGLQVICHGRLSLYLRGGQYQIVVDYMEPKGVGALQLAFEQLKKKLASEGLFDEKRKRPIPFLPRKIGIVTSPTGAAIRDMIKVIRRRFPNIDILLVPARVQGEGSAAEIVEAIALLNKRNDIDVIIVGRGGGSIEDLWAFNEEIVARAIFNSRLPVISAVGHEVDFTIADFVADMRAPTPSAAAEIAVPLKAELVSYLEEARRRLAVELMRYVQNRIDTVRELKKRLIPPTKSLPEYYRYIDSLKERMFFSLKTIVKQRENVFKSLAAELNHLSPLVILSKGYSIITKKGDMRPIRSSDELQMGDEIHMRYYNGSAEGMVTKVIEN